MAGLSEWQELCADFESSLTEITDKDCRKKVILEHLKKSDKLNVRVPEFEKDLEWINTDGSLHIANELKGGVVVLDFFTYCCVNCLHILPDLEALEHAFPVENGVAVIGVHSAKFENEKVLANIISAVLRHSINHPVVNDADATLWNQLMIQCWPTLTVISPSGNLLFSFVGEGHREQLLEFISVAVDYYKGKGELTLNKLPIKPIRNNLPPSLLSFPGKICVSEDGRVVVIADSGHHRILVLGTDGIVKHVIGGRVNGRTDGTFSDARFNSPQGVCVWGDQIYVADTENHLIRRINLTNKTVETVTGTGKMGQDKQGGKLWTDQEITSPWDIVLCSSVGSREKDLLLIAMAGNHQIWGLFLKDGKWLKGREYKAGSCVRLAGTGNEENRNNSYPEKAGFAQPSGLALSAIGDAPVVFIADAESSSVRSMSLKDGAVKALVGGERDPMNLFAYGDTDGAGYSARLQHPLGVAVLSSDPPTLLVADTYNHKIKQVDVASRHCSSLLGSGAAGNSLSADWGQVCLNEPGGICVDGSKRLLYIADTNNHSIKVADLNKRTVTEFPVLFPTEGSDVTDTGVKVKPLTSPRLNPVTLPQEAVAPDGQVLIAGHVCFPQGAHLTDGAPSAWQVYTWDNNSPANLCLVQKQPFKDGEKNLPEVVVDIPKSVVGNLTVCFESVLYYCVDNGLCKMKASRHELSVQIDKNGPEKVNQCIKLELD